MDSAAQYDDVDTIMTMIIKLDLSVLTVTTMEMQKTIKTVTSMLFVTVKMDRKQNNQ